MSFMNLGRSLSERKPFKYLLSNFSFFSRSGFAVADQALFAGTNFIINILLIRFLTEIEYGAFATVYAVFLLIGAVYQGLVMEPMLIYGSGKFSDHWHRYLGIVIFIHWVLSLLLSIFILIAAWGFQEAGSYLIATNLLAMAIVAPFILLQWSLRKAFYIVSKIHHAASGGFFYIVLMIGGIFLFRELGILSSVMGFFVMGLTSLITCLWFMYLLKPQLIKEVPEIKISTIIKEHFSYGKWALPTKILMWITSNVYYTVLPIFVGLAASGALRASMNLIMPILHANTAISTVLVPSFVRILKKDGMESLHKRTRFGLILFTLTTGTYWLFLIFFGRWASNFIFDGKYNEYALPLIFLIMGIIPLSNGFAEILNGAMKAMGYFDRIFWATGTSAAVTLTVSMLLLAFGGIYGAYLGLAVASLSGAIIAFILYTRGRKTLKTQHIQELHYLNDDGNSGKN